MKKIQDHYFNRAKNENYVARSIYKLKQIQSKFKIIKKNQTILDLGCFPGSWSQYALEVLNKSGQIIGVDIQKMEKTLSDNFVFLQSDVFFP